MSRKKAAALVAPTTIDEGLAAVGRYAALSRQLDQLRLDADEAIGQIKAAHDAAAAPIEQERKDLFLQIRTWWAVAGAALTEGKRKSIEFAGCMIGDRTTTPSVKLPKGLSVAGAIHFIKSSGLPSSFWPIRVKEALDKPALAKILNVGGFAAGFFTQRGFTLEQREEFFIAPIETPEGDPDLTPEKETIQ